MRATKGRITVPVAVHSVVEVVTGMVEVRLQGRALSGMRFGAASHVVVRIPVGATTQRRVYSVWAFDRLAGVIRLRIALHGSDTPGCAWATSVAKGDEVLIEPPRTKMSLESASRYHVFVGEETGAVPLLAMRAALHRSAEGGRAAYGVLECPDTDGEMPGFPGVPALPWVHRGSAPAVASNVLLEAVRDLRLPAEPGVAYVAGESLTCQMLQQHLIQERGWPRGSIKVQQHWAQDRPGFGAGREEPDRPLR